MTRKKLTADDLLTHDERESVMLAFLSGRGDTGASEQEIARVVQWAAEARFDAHMLRMVLEGLIDLDWQHDRIRFLPPARRTTEPSHE